MPEYIYDARRRIARNGTRYINRIRLGRRVTSARSSIGPYLYSRQNACVCGYVTFCPTGDTLRCVPVRRATETNFSHFRVRFTRTSLE